MCAKMFHTSINHYIWEYSWKRASQEEPYISLSMICKGYEMVALKWNKLYNPCKVHHRMGDSNMRARMIASKNQYANSMNAKWEIQIPSIIAKGDLS